MNSFLLWAALGLAAAVPALDGSRNTGCPKCDCCGCCETGTCECCLDECPTGGANADRKECCGSGCCRA